MVITWLTGELQWFQHKSRAKENSIIIYIQLTIDFLINFYFVFSFILILALVVRFCHQVIINLKWCFHNLTSDRNLYGNIMIAFSHVMCNVKWQTICHAFTTQLTVNSWFSFTVMGKSFSRLIHLIADSHPNTIIFDKNNFF